MRRSRTAALLAAIATGCAPRPEASPPLPVVAETSSTRAGPATASLGFGRVLPDAEVEATLGSVPVTEVRMLAGSSAVGQVLPTALPARQALPEARRLMVRALRRSACRTLLRHTTLLDERPHVRPAPGDRDPGARFALSAVEDALGAAERLAGGDPAVFGVAVAATPDELLRLADDPRVVEVQTARDAEGQLRVATPPTRNPPRRERISPAVEALPAEEVRARLERHRAEPWCMETFREARLDEPTVRVEPGTPVQGVVVSARTAVDTVPEARAPDPVRMRVVVELENRSGAPVELEVLGCTVGTRLYRAWGDAEPAIPVAPGAMCMQDPHAVTLAAGERRELESHVQVGRLPGAGLAPGRYAVAATLRLPERTLELPAGHLELGDPLEGLAYHARAGLRGDTLVGSATVVNRGARTVELRFGSCALSLRAYRTDLAATGPAWRSELRQLYGGGAVYGCDLVGRVSTLAPGDSLSRPFGVRSPVIEVLGDSLPDRRYRLAAVLELNDVETPEIPAGEAHLAAARPPLPAERLSWFTTFRARPEHTADSVRVVVRGTLTAAGGSLERYAADCPVQLLAYRSRRDRDAAPRAGAPAWTSHPECDREREVVHSLSRGEWREFRAAASAREILASGLPPGRYYFAVVVDHRAGRVHLAAGETVLSR